MVRVRGVCALCVCLLIVQTLNDCARLLCFAMAADHNKFVGSWSSKGLQGTFFKGPLPENKATSNSRTSYSRDVVLTLLEDITFTYSCTNSVSTTGTEAFEVQESKEEDAGRGTWKLEGDNIVLSGKFYLDLEYGYEEENDKVHTDDVLIALAQFGDGGDWAKSGTS